MYDVGIDDNTSFIVCELIEGRRLRDDIERGPLPTKRLLDVAVQIAAGLNAAHEAGIAHRDLKPDNVMVTRDGRVKIVDFGLARTYAPRPAAPGTVAASDLETDTQIMTTAITGTPQYMSPEQARGGDADFRSDQFSLGLILYEMATGAHPFRRDTAAQTMWAIVDEDAPPVADANPKVPTLLRWVIERCLAKDPVDRYASTADLARDLVTLQGHLTEIGTDGTRREVLSGRTRLTRGLAIGGGLALLAVVAAAFVRGQTAQPAALTFVPLVTDASFQGAPAWSPDGKTLAYVSHVDGLLQVFTRTLASSLRHQVTRSRFDCVDPFWSRDGTRIFYHSLARDAESLWSISAAGGPPKLVIENATRATLAPDGRTLAFFREDVSRLPRGVTGAGDRSLWIAAVTGTNQRRYAGFDKRGFVDGSVRFAPDGSRLLVWAWGWSEKIAGVPSPTFWIVPWPSGAPYEVLPSLADAARAAVEFDWLPDGRSIVAALRDARTESTHLWIADTERGTSRRVTATPGSENRPAVTPDGTRVAFTAEAVDFDVLEIPLDGAAARTMLATSRNELDPAFAPDGTQYAYVSDRGGTLELWLRSRQGQWERPIVSAAQFRDATWALGSPAISPDGQRVAYQRYGRETGYQIWMSAARSGLRQRDGVSPAIDEGHPRAVGRPGRRILVQGAGRQPHGWPRRRDGGIEQQQHGASPAQRAHEGANADADADGCEPVAPGVAKLVDSALDLNAGVAGRLHQHRLRVPAGGEDERDHAVGGDVKGAHDRPPAAGPGGVEMLDSRDARPRPQPLVQPGWRQQAQEQALDVVVPQRRAVLAREPLDVGVGLRKGGSPPHVVGDLAREERIPVRPAPQQKRQHRAQRRVANDALHHRRADTCGEQPAHGVAETDVRRGQRRAVNLRDEIGSDQALDERHDVDVGSVASVLAAEPAPDGVNRETLSQQPDCVDPAGRRLHHPAGVSTDQRQPNAADPGTSGSAVPPLGRSRPIVDACSGTSCKFLQAVTEVPRFRGLCGDRR